MADSTKSEGRFEATADYASIAPLARSANFSPGVSLLPGGQQHPRVWWLGLGGGEGLAGLLELGGNGLVAGFALGT